MRSNLSCSVSTRFCSRTRTSKLTGAATIALWTVLLNMFVLLPPLLVAGHNPQGSSETVSPGSKIKKAAKAKVTKGSEQVFTAVHYGRRTPGASQNDKGHPGRG